MEDHIKPEIEKNLQPDNLGLNQNGFMGLILFALFGLLTFNLFPFSSSQKTTLPSLPEKKALPQSIRKTNNVPSDTTSQVLSGNTQNPYPKEIYVPLGTGSTSSKEWVEMGGVESVIDLSRYPVIESVVFEASMRIPTANGRVHAKLYNVTDKHDAWSSEVWVEGSTGYRAEAIGVSLSSGRKVYRVKMKSTMGYEAILDLARLKILLK